MRFGWFYKTKRFTGFTNLVNFDAVLRYFSVLLCDLAVFRPPFTPHGNGPLSLAK